MNAHTALDELDRKANEVFPGRVVRKSLVRRVKVGDEVEVKVVDIDEMGRIRLSRRALLGEKPGQQRSNSGRKGSSRSRRSRH